jgi:hypothetical protein
LNFSVVYYNVKTYDIWERNMTVRSEVYTENMDSLGFGDLREGVTLRRLILRSLEYFIT